ncbi:MAG: hypothetical protein ACHQ1H_05715, partial [Nitrososphaerales archaeon]
MFNNNPFDFIKTKFNDQTIGCSQSYLRGNGPSIPAPAVNTAIPIGFSVNIINQYGQSILEKTFVSEEEFQRFCNKCTLIEPTGFASISFNTARIDNITDFAKTFFF